MSKQPGPLIWFQVLFFVWLFGTVYVLMHPEWYWQK